MVNMREPPALVHIGAVPFVLKAAMKGNAEILNQIVNYAGCSLAETACYGVNEEHQQLYGNGLTAALSGKNVDTIDFCFCHMIMHRQVFTGKHGY